jgi:hypothetical protein
MTTKYNNLYRPRVNVAMKNKSQYSLKKLSRRCMLKDDFHKSAKIAYLRQKVIILRE